VVITLFNNSIILDVKWNVRKEVDNAEKVLLHYNGESKNGFMNNILKRLCEYDYACHDWKNRHICQQLVIYPYKDSRVVLWEQMAIDTYINCTKSLRKLFCLNK